MKEIHEEEMERATVERDGLTLPDREAVRAARAHSGGVAKRLEAASPDPRAARLWMGRVRSALDLAEYNLIRRLLAALEAEGTAEQAARELDTWAAHVRKNNESVGSDDMTLAEAMEAGSIALRELDRIRKTYYPLSITGSLRPPAGSKEERDG